MHGAAVTLAQEYSALQQSYDVLICSDMLDVAAFKGLTDTSDTKVITYYHENQLSYPWSPDDPDVALQRDNHYGWINYTTALASDLCMFNSNYHRLSFTDEVRRLLGKLPDYQHIEQVDHILDKSVVMPIGIDPSEFHTPEHERHTFLWNHRWEYDKNPDAFFDLLMKLNTEGYDFDIIVCGEQYRNAPPIFAQAKTKLQDRIKHFGYAASRSEYLTLLRQSTIFPVTSNQDFFGISVVEAIAAGVHPLLPKRLAYPEHLPLPQHEHMYYTNEEDLLQKCRVLLNQKPHSPQVQTYIKEKYDWSTIIKSFDVTISRLLNR